MIDIRKDISKIKAFIKSGIMDFEKSKGTPSAVGVYSCPEYGWVSLNFNKVKTIEEASSNCPDFEFVEEDLIDIPTWRIEYEMEEEVVRIINSRGREISFLIEDLGDENFNEPVFEALVEIVIELKYEFESYQNRYLVQILDSDLMIII